MGMTIVHKNVDEEDAVVCKALVQTDVLLLPKHPKFLESVQRCLDIQARGARAGCPQRVEEVPGEPEKGGLEGEEDQRGEGQDLPRDLG